MKRNLKKAMAFAMAVATVVANFGVSSPVSGAEYSEPEEILDAEYDMYTMFGDGAYFTNWTEVEDEDGETTSYLDGFVIVDKNGETSTIELENEDGTYKYKDASYVSDDCVALIADDDTYCLYYTDGTYVGAGEEKYKDILVLKDGNYLVSNDTVYKVIDKNGEVVAEDLFEPVECEEMYWTVYYTYNEYIILGRGIYTEDATYETEVKIFDSSYKEADVVEMGNGSARVVEDYLIVYSEKDIAIYDSNFDKLDFSYSRDDIQDPSESEEGVAVLADYTIISVYGPYKYEDDKTYFEMSVQLYYEDCTGDTYYYDYESHIYDCDTLEELDISVIHGPTSGDLIEYEYSIGDTGVVCKDCDEIFYVAQYYYNSELLYTQDDIYDYVESELAIENATGYYISEIPDIDAILYEVNVYLEDSSEVRCVVHVTKDAGYSLEDATIYEKAVYDYYPGSLTFVVFWDGSCYFKGEIYDSIDGANVFYEYNEEEREWETFAYCLREGEEGSYTWTLYNADDEAMAEVPLMICNYSESGIIVTKENTFFEDGSGETNFGCYYFDKTLTSSEEVLEELEKVEEGDTVEVKVEENKPIKSEVMETIKGKDIDVVIETKSGITWTINGKDVTGTELKDVDLTVEIVDKVVPEEAINNIDLGDTKIEDVVKIELSIAHTGDFGFKADMTIDVGAENEGKYASRFYYNPETAKLEFQESVLIDALGKAVFGYTHASDYVVLLTETAYVEDTTTDDTTTDDTTTDDTTTDDTTSDDTTSNDTTTDDTTSDDTTTDGTTGELDGTPGTGDSSNVAALMAVVVVAAVALMLAQKRRVSAN